jgi:hypothetical protein
MWNSPAALLIGAAVLGAASVFTPLIPVKLRSMSGGLPLLAELIIDYVPVPLGCVSMWFCVRAWKKSRHKLLVALYAIALAPFAFCYPLWYTLLYIAYRTGRLHGAMP